MPMICVHQRDDPLAVIMMINFIIYKLLTQLRLFVFYKLSLLLQTTYTMLIADDKSADSIDPEFLTFRHNSPQAVATSGRSIYSQRFDCKSLQKYPIFDAHNSEREDLNERTHKKIKHTVKQKHLRTVKSQQKYRHILSGQFWNSEQNGIEEYESEFINDNSYKKRTYNNRDQCKKVQMNDSSLLRKQNYANCERNENQKTKENRNDEQLMKKNNELKNQLSKLVRSMKKQQRKQLTLNQQMHELQGQIAEKDNQIEQQIKSIEELEQISQQNMKECNRIIDNIRQISSKNDELATNLQSLQESVDSSEISIETCRQDGAKDRALFSQLRDGINNLNKMKTSSQINVTRLEEEIMAMQFQIQQMRVQEFELARIFGLALDSFSSHNQSQNHSHHSHQSHHSSAGSASENDRYY